MATFTPTANPAAIAAVQDILKEVWVADNLESQLLEGRASRKRELDVTRERAMRVGAGSRRVDDDVDSYGCRDAIHDPPMQLIDAFRPRIGPDEEAVAKPART